MDVRAHPPCIVLATLALGITALAPAARAVEPGTVVDRCAFGSADAVAGQAALHALDAAVDVPDARLDVLEAELEALLDRPCFGPATLERWGLAFESVPALRTFWRDGGYAWLAHFVWPGETPNVVAWPRGIRPTLDLESARVDDPLRPLLCPRDDDACGRETRGWVLRAEQAHREHAALHAHEERAVAVRDDYDAGPSCASVARAEPALERYVAWYQCEGDRRLDETVLPIGQWRAPREGWLVVSGRRGHYRYCDEIRAYDLATGAAYLQSWCGSLIASEPYVAEGPSDVDTGGEPRCIGSLPIAALREAACSLFVGERANEHHKPYAELTRPRAIPTRLTADWLGSLIGRGVGGSGQTLLAVRWIDGDVRRVDRRLMCPDSEWEAEDTHSAALVRIAEAALEPGCSEAQLAACPAASCPPWE